MHSANHKKVDPALKSATISLDWVVNPNCGKQSRFDHHSIQQLASSIDYLGLLHPPLVRRLNHKPEYEIVSGVRRFLACRLLNWKEMPCIDISDCDRRGIDLIENLQREDLTAISEARCLARFKAETGLKDEELGRLSNRSRTWVTQSLGISRLPVFILDEAEHLRPSPTRDLLITVSQCRTREQQLLVWNFVKEGKTRSFLRSVTQGEQPRLGFPSVACAAGRVVRLLEKAIKQHSDILPTELDRLKQMIATINALVEAFAMQIACPPADTRTVTEENTNGQ